MTCYLHIVRWLSANLNWARMVTDVIIAAAPGSYKVLSDLKLRYYRDEDYWMRSGGRR
jgi:hypothetical protein